MKIAGVVVIYNPKSNVLENIKSYHSILDKLFIVDNSDNKEFNISYDSFTHSEYISMGGNKGIAAALKVGADRALKDGFDFCLTMDQDSIFPTEKMELINDFLTDKKIDEFGILGLNYNSNNTKLNIIEVPCWLTSGNFINLNNYSQIRGFTKELFIDYVDIEIDEQFFLVDKKVGYIDGISLSHSIGNPLKKKLLFWTFTCMNHSPIRYYYRYRNALYLYKKNKKFYKKKYKHDLYVETLKMVLFEKKKIEKIKMIKRGRKDAKMGILGPYVEERK